MPDTRVNRYFDPSTGLLRSRLEHWETRPEQVRMAETVMRCLDQGGACAVEAATGTGKTFSYLVPALLSGGRVVVATGTRNLQDQIFQKDLPLLRSVQGLDGPAVLVKGLGNYLCRRKLEGLKRRTGSPTLDPHLPVLLAWAAATETGDVAELEGLPDGYAERLDVVSGAGSRLGPSCPFFHECFVTALRRRAEKARLLVVNHHLLFADLVLREVADGVLPDYNAVIFDEAHRLDDVATEFFGHRISFFDVASAIRDGLRVIRGEYSFEDGTRRRGRGGESVLRAAERSARALFEGLGRRLGPLIARRKGGRAAPPDLAVLRAAVEEPFLDGPLEGLYHELDDLLDRAALCVASTQGAGEVASMAGRRIVDARDGIATVLDQDVPGYVFWAEVAAQDPVLTRLGGSPVDLAPMFRERVFERIGSVVLTSATLSPDGTMRHLARTIGYPEDDAESLVLPSPFDVHGSAILYVPSHLPEPGDPTSTGQVAAEITRLVELTGGGALVLFSSWRTMRKCFEICSATIRDHEIFMQGDAPKHELLGRLRTLGDGVLLATASFREGVDVPGPALRLVVVDKIPFSVPDEPVVEARARRIRERGGDPFGELLLPSAALGLKQGLGRLLRTRTDRGVLAVLDPRIWSRRYGARILGALPACPVTREFADVERFWKTIEG